MLFIILAGDLYVLYFSIQRGNLFAINTYGKPKIKNTVCECPRNNYSNIFRKSETFHLSVGHPVATCYPTQTSDIVPLWQQLILGYPAKYWE
jgi:hypothetical protein